jgi:probable phosphoglycerate mutase
VARIPPRTHQDQRVSEIWLVRHGATEWSAQGRHTGRTDLPLTPDGERAAVALRDRLAGVRFDLRLVSPLLRARRTAELAGVVDAEVEPRTREWDYGDYEGLTRAEICARLGVDHWSPWDDPVAGGETLADVAARADEAAVLLRARTGERAVVVAHGHFLRILAARWCGLDAGAGAHLELEPASVSVLGSDRGTPTIRHWNG